MKTLYSSCALAASFCLSSAAQNPQSLVEPPPADTALRVMIWNTEKGSNPYGPNWRHRVLRVIQEHQPHLVLWQESYKLEDNPLTLGQWAAKELGWNAWQGNSPHLCIVTPFEMLEKYSHQPRHGVGAKLRDPEGRIFFAWSIWLDWRHSLSGTSTRNPSLSDAELLACETETSSRLQNAKDIVARLQSLGHFNRNTPLLVGGDWNTPSHLDWTDATATIFPHRRPLPLPVSHLIHEHGFEDTFRIVYPDPVRTPGHTWSPLRKDHPRERIDRLYVKNPETKPKLIPIRAYTLPRDWADADLPRETSPFPSDHGAVVIDFEWR